MADTQETVADIIVEMRGLVEPDDILPHPYEALHVFADRLEAAHEREAATAEKSSAVGDAAKLREALKLYDRIFQDRTLICDCDIVCGARTLARAALAAPPRNCDRPECATTKAATDVWRKEDGGRTAYYAWLLAPAPEKEGGNK